MNISTITHNLFPPLLQEIYDPPEDLSIRGVDFWNSPKYENTTFLTVVGTRHATTYGKEVVNKLVSDLQGLDICLVSGLAYGIDTEVHKAALEYNLKTIAVLGSGLHDSVLYPKVNVRLAHAIIESGGALISESDTYFQAQTWSFPKRNRIMAGMSEATLVIEASLESGTLVTAHLALDYNREVLAVPGSIFSSQSKGVHYLLKEGATCIEHSKDLLYALGFSEEESTEQKLETSVANLSREEQLMLEEINDGISKEALIQKLSTTQSISQVVVCISKLEIENIIKEEGGYIRKVH